MKQIWKWRLDGTIEMPMGAKVLCVQMQHGVPHIWAMVNPAMKTEPRHFELYGTGWPLTDNPGRYVGTVQVGSLVWHVFTDAEVS